VERLNAFYSPLFCKNQQQAAAKESEKNKVAKAMK